MAIDEGLDATYGGLKDKVDVEIAGGTYSVSFCDQQSIEWGTAVRRLTKPYRSMMRRGVDVPLDKDRGIAVAAFVEVCLHGWSNVKVKPEDEPIPYSRDKAIELFRRYPRLFTDLLVEASDMHRFRANELDNAAGN